MIEFEINGKTVRASEGSMVIEAADKAGIPIPRFCYHPQLSIAANCRMCLVDIEGSKKPLPACATPVTSGMKVNTHSEMAKSAQKSVMEFLLINHPLDCPICDQGGECELQDLALGYGKGVSRFTEGKRSVQDENLGPLVATEMTRCIHCTRCVRFGQEIAGTPELGLMNRGEHARIETYIKKTLESEVSGNIIDLCPVGALTNKPFRFAARAWEMTQTPAVAPHDCLGSNLYVHTRGYEYNDYRTVLRTVPRPNEAINEVWLSDRDRYSYQALKSPERLAAPRIKHNGVWQEADWSIALKETAARLQAIVKQRGAAKLAGLASPNMSVESLMLFQRLLRGLGTDNIDHRMRQVDFRHQGHQARLPQLPITLPEFEKQGAVLLVGSHIRHEQPLAAIRMRKAACKGGQIMAINPIDYSFPFELSQKKIVDLDAMPRALAQVAQCVVSKQSDEKLARLLENVQPDAQAKAMAKALVEQEQALVLLGACAHNHPQASVLFGLASLIAEHTGAHLAFMTDGANSAGACLAGVLPHRNALGETIKKPGLDAQAMFSALLNGYVLMGVEPEFDCAMPHTALAALEQAECVVVLSSFTSPAMERYADIILPMAPFSEFDGSFINVQGNWQVFSAATRPWKSNKPAHDIVHELMQALDIEQDTYTSSDEMLNALRHTLNDTPRYNATWQVPTSIPKPSEQIMRVGDWPIYRVDSVVRRADALQATAHSDVAFVHMHPELAASLKCREGDALMVEQNGGQAILPVKCDASMAPLTVWIPSGLEQTAGLAVANGLVNLKKVDA